MTKPYGMTAERRFTMSMIKCADCGVIYDTDEQMEVDKKGNCICNDCYERLNGDKK